MLPGDRATEALPELISLEQEASFWIAYQEVQQDFHTQPDRAMEALKKARTARPLIDHWPASYEPTQADLDRLQAVIESNLRAVILTDEARTVPNSTKTVELRPVTSQVVQPETDDFWLTLGEDLVRNRWGDSIAELLTRLEQEPENKEVKEAVEQVLQRLDQKRYELAETRPSPNRLADRVTILEALLQIPAGFSSDLPAGQQLRDELAEIRNLEHRIAQEQLELFRNPGQVLDRALASGYELFDDTSLTVAVLKAVYAAGRWDHDKFSREIADLEEQAGRFLEMTTLLEERKQTLEQALAFYEPWSKTPSPDKTGAFLSNTLQLYLTTAQAQLQAGEDATQSLARAGHILDHAAQFLTPIACTTYQNLHEHLVDLSYGKSASIASNLPGTEAQLETWFKACQFEECYANLAELATEAEREKWEIRLKDAGRLRDFLAEGEPQLENGYFRKKQNVQSYTAALDTLCRHIKDSEPMAYALYKDEIESLYQQIWQKLEQLDKKSAACFEPTV